MPALRTRETASDSLELRTGMDVPNSSLPTLAIIAPTPRAFTFPTSHNLDISPYSTPSNSPFEPDLNNPFGFPSPTSSRLSTPSPLTRTLSPDSSVSVSSPRSDNLDAERRPRKGDKDYIKRPENAFMLFRRKCCEDQQQVEEECNGPTTRKKQRQADLSKAISRKWKSLSKNDRQYWEDLAKEKKRVHQEKYPGYVFRPQRVRDKDGRARNKKYTKRNRAGKRRQDEADLERETASYLVPFPGRSTSASDTIPAVSYHTVHIPVISTIPPHPSSASSSSLPIPQISQTFSGTVRNIASNFEYLPSPHSMLHSEAGPQVMWQSTSWTAGAQADALQRQSSELMRNLFNLPAHETPQSTARSVARLQVLSSPLSSAASSPISGPFTPSSDPLDQSSYNKPQLYPSTFNPAETCGSNHTPWVPMPADIQAGLIPQPDAVHNYSPWKSHNAIWQTESNMLSGDDFDLQIIPPIELSQSSQSMMMMPEYDDGAAFGIAPSATLNSFALYDFPQEYFLSVDGFATNEDSSPRFAIEDECMSVS
ncbi:hypothetical protein F5876DRAFT_42597 [Lentinula aff. lateritia]|uniref:Uncharacterized protein n=1 Tax=Lentinula aff. lateritia TaxID=2804960 RepID=A0ACC1TZ77_9AGAR|nr:hypothetical protein F5876DRAFT_42597 [Lentinula aff. lateritia]